MGARELWEAGDPRLDPGNWDHSDFWLGLIWLSQELEIEECSKMGSYKEVPQKKMQALYENDLISAMPDCRLMIVRKRTCCP